MSGLDLTEAVVYPAECTEGVTRRDEFQPCDKPAVAVRLDPEGSEPYPVCARHARADMVLLPDLIAAVRAQVAAEIRAGIGAEPLLMYVTDWRDGMETAEAIARGVS